MKTTIENLVKKALESVGVSEARFTVEHPTNLTFGDYTTNAGIVSKKAPELLAYLEDHKPEGVEKIEIKSGFINFYLTKEFFKESIGEIIERGSEFGKNKNLKGQKTIVEYTDPNPFKEFHIGHLMSNAIGESIARISEWNGAEVMKACYQGDVGMHVAKALWKDDYALGSKAYEEDEQAKKEIQDINKKIYEKSDPELNKKYEEGKERSLEEFEKIYKKLGTKFDFNFFESEVADFGKKLVEENTGEIFEKGEGGAVIFNAEKFDKYLHIRVFINSEGLPTYEAKELGLAKYKFEKYPYDKSIVITGNEVNDYFKVLLCALGQIYPELAQKTEHLSHGMLRLTTGKMSSRTGEVITAESLIETVKEKVKGDEQVAIGAIKYMILRQSIGNDIIFDIEKSVSTEGDSGVYLQYAYVRAKSVTEKGRLIIRDFDLLKESTSQQDQTLLEKILYRFPEIVLRACDDLSPNYLVTYLTEVSSAFNNFYATTQIINPNDVPESYHRLALSKATEIVLKNGLDILGIPAPERM